MGAETAERMQQPQVEIAPVHDQVLAAHPRPKRVEIDPGREHIDEENLPPDHELEEADPRPVVVHVVSLGIEGDLGRAIEGSEQRLQLAGLVNEGVGGRARGAFYAEQPAHGMRKETGNHLNLSGRDRKRRSGPGR